MQTKTEDGNASNLVSITSVLLTNNAYYESASQTLTHVYSEVLARLIGLAHKVEAAIEVAQAYRAIESVD